MREQSIEYLVVKGGAIKYAMDHLIKPEFKTRFHDPVKEWVLAGPDEIRMVGGKKLYIQRTKPVTYTDIEKVKPDFMVLAKGGQVTREQFVQLLEAGALTIGDTKAVAKLCASRLSQLETKYDSTTKEGEPALRWPLKGAIQPWFYALRTVADLTLQMTRAAKTKAVKTIDKLLAQK